MISVQEGKKQHIIDYKAGDNLLEELQFFKLDAECKYRYVFQDCAFLAMKRFCCTSKSPYNSTSFCAKVYSAHIIFLFCKDLL